MLSRSSRLDFSALHKHFSLFPGKSWSYDIAFIIHLKIQKVRLCVSQKPAAIT